MKAQVTSTIVSEAELLSAAVHCEVLGLILSFAQIVLFGACARKVPNVLGLLLQCSLGFNIADPWLESPLVRARACFLDVLGFSVQFRQTGIKQLDSKMISPHRAFTSRFHGRCLC